MNSDACANIPGAEGVASIQCIVPLVTGVIRAVVSLGAVALFIMLLVGGFNFLFSAGDQKKLEAAKGSVTQAIAGIILMSVAYLIILTIERFTGVTVTDFNITQ